MALPADLIFRQPGARHFQRQAGFPAAFEKCPLWTHKTRAELDKRSRAQPDFHGISLLPNLIFSLEHPENFHKYTISFGMVLMVNPDSALEIRDERGKSKKSETYTRNS